MSILKFKNPDGTWESVAAIKGEPGKDGAIQYQAGEGIKIEDNVISSDVDLSNYYSKYEISPSGVYSIRVSGSLGGSFNADTLSLISKYINEYYTLTQMFPAFVINYKSSSCSVLYTLTSADTSAFHYLGYHLSTNSTAPEYIQGRTLNFWYTGGLGNINITSTSITLDNHSFLTTDNNAAYTPTANYHPATKKYVDDSIANIDIPSGSEEDPTKFGKIFRLEIEYKSMTSGFARTIAVGTEEHIKLISTVNEAINHCIDNNISSVFFMIDSPTNNNSNYLNGLIGITNSRLNNLSIGLALYINMIQLGTMKYLDERYRLQFSVVNVDGRTICDETKDVTFLREDINFAKKSYVDNAIKTAITSVLEADY